ncbi:unnamed protein product [Mesocestoides corti]|uniref:Gcp-like domain-containing protein n=1 Tax=Mesocestoides corti TaxID=53468 RepID=A0A0R3U4V2_MESCO|nr:unnamed protein product [Mesocestoides corti]
MALSLKVGVMYAKQLAVTHKLPIIPIHHMEAHALTAMLTDERLVCKFNDHFSLNFPYLVLLVSGGHSLLAVAKDVDDFLLLGTSLDISPGDCLDKIARRLRLSAIGNGIYSQIPGGMAVELMARTSKNPTAYPMPTPRSVNRDCDFSFSGIRSAADRLINRLEKENGGVISMEDIASICSSCQTAVTRLFCRRLQRAIEYCILERHLPPSVKIPASSWPTPRVPSNPDPAAAALVLSGGVASNTFMRTELAKVATHYGMRLVAPPPRLCTDNGVMIAWNGVLLHSRGKRLECDPSMIDFTPRAPLGKDIRSLVSEACIRIKPLPVARARPPNKNP